MNKKRHDTHFLKAKKTGANSKLFFNSGSKEFLPIIHLNFYNVSVTTNTNVFCKEGLEPN